MHATTMPLFSLTAADLMTRDVLRLHREMPLRDAANLLFRSQISGAPVVDDHGRCVGVLSASDFVRKEVGVSPSTPRDPLLLTCPFLVKFRAAEAETEYLCVLPPGACSIQSRRQARAGETLTCCSQPHAVPVDWQVVHAEELPEDAVARYMTADPVTATPETPLHELAQMMTDAHVHRVIVVNDDREPVGVVSSTDVLAVVARAGKEQEAANEPGTLAAL
jgi:CBS domain-containing protein